MGINAKYSLQRTMIIYFLLIGFASLLVGVEFVFDMQRPALKNNLINNFEKYSRNEIVIEEVFQPLEKMRDKATLMIAIIMVVMVIVLTMFMKNITEPLQYMIDMSKKISKGDLRQQINIHSNNELAELGNVINDLSSNLQEAMLLSQKISTGVGRNIALLSELLEQEEMHPDDRDKAKQELHLLQHELDLLDELVSYFDFYAVER